MRLPGLPVTIASILWLPPLRSWPPLSGRCGYVDANRIGSLRMTISFTLCLSWSEVRSPAHIAQHDLSLDVLRGLLFRGLGMA